MDPFFARFRPVILFLFMRSSISRDNISRNIFSAFADRFHMIILQTKSVLTKRQENSVFLLREQYNVQQWVKSYVEAFLK